MLWDAQVAKYTVPIRQNKWTWASNKELSTLRIKFNAHKFMVSILQCAGFVKLKVSSFSNSFVIDNYRYDKEYANYRAPTLLTLLTEWKRSILLGTTKQPAFYFVYPSLAHKIIEQIVVIVCATRSGEGKGITDVRRRTWLHRKVTLVNFV